MREKISRKWNQAISAWNQYFFAEASLNSLALYRAVFCLWICYEACGWLPYVQEMFSSDWFHVRYTFFSAQMSTAEAYFFCILLVLSSFCAAIGYRTRLSLVVTWIAYVLLHSVDSMNEKAIETIILVVLTILLFSPCDGLWSVDVLAGRQKRRERGPIFFQRLLQWEFAQIYFFAGLTKMVVPEWPSGVVVADSISGRWGSDLGVAVAGLLPEPATRALGFGTVLFELFIGPLLLTERFRWVAVSVAVGFHLGIEVLMRIGTLGCHFLTADLLIFLHPDVLLRYCHRVGFHCRRGIEVCRQVTRRRTSSC